MGRHKRPKGTPRKPELAKKFKGASKGRRYGAAHAVRLRCSFCGEGVHMLKDTLARERAAGRKPKCLLCNGTLVPV